MKGNLSTLNSIYTNVMIYTMNPYEPVVQSIVSRNERIIDMGSYEDMLLHWGRNGTTIIDLEGKKPFLASLIANFIFQVWASIHLSLTLLE